MNPFRGLLAGVLLGATGVGSVSVRDTRVLLQKELQHQARVAEDSCADHNTAELCKQAADWGLCTGWIHGMCLSLKADCHDLRTANQCRQSKAILGISCRGWGGSTCLSQKQTCKDVTDEAACAFSQANLGLVCKGWEGGRCLPKGEQVSEDELAARAKLRQEAKARSQLRIKAKDEAQAAVDKKERQAARAEQRKLEEAKKMQETDEEQRIMAKEALRQRHQERVAALKAEEEAKKQEEEEAKLRAEEEARLKAEEDERLVEEKKRQEEEEKQRQKEEEAKRKEQEEQMRRTKFGEEIYLRVSDYMGHEVEIKMRKSMKMRVLMGVAKTRLSLPDGKLSFKHKNTEITENLTPQALGLQDKDRIDVEVTK
uniref:Ubiquitin-like domain-containing protein n=1 Tax=Alexandrium catenella TaxID=2925 RepID=A0A7S1WXG9_ALECA|mmetsp:Transcript_97543/g.259104  ORF Transcript_97543/g.259104 Transcript_97543/m.259104 type:complete len:371 (+) Transcript_97543:67-1179(+)